LGDDRHWLERRNRVILTDTHCHLDLEQFDADRAEVLEGARREGVVRILIPGLDAASSHRAVRLAETDPILFAAIGVHPTETSATGQDALDEIRKLAGHPRVKAIGEIGLDYYWDSAPHDAQRNMLKEQLALAESLALPVVIHLREQGDAESGAGAADLLAILEAWAGGLGSGHPLKGRAGVLHSFSGSAETARRALELGFFIGVTGPVTYKNAERRREVIRSLPLDRLLIETDAPFLAPHPRRGKRNEPAFVGLIADKIAEIHSTTREQAGRITSANAARLFGWGG
jgi:TatD DNase family protein